MSLKLSHKIGFILVMILSLSCSPSADQVLSSYEKTVQSYEAQIKANPKDVLLRIEFAQFLYDFRDYEKVIEVASGLTRPQAKILIAKAYARIKEYTSAIEVFDQLEEDIDDSECLYLYGRTLEDKNLFARAMEIYKKVGEPFAEDAQIRTKLIKTKIEEEKVPSYITDLLKESEAFLESQSDEAGVILLVDENIEIFPNNTSLATVHVVELILNERGKEFGEVEMGYDSTYEKLELEYARTITPDQRVVYAGRENTRDVNRYLNYPLYSNAKAFIVSMPKVEVGAIIEYKIKVYSSKLVDEDKFSFLYRVKEGYPIYKAIFNLVVPKESKVNFKLVNKDYYVKNQELKPKVTTEKERHYRWEFNEVEPIIPEENMPPTSFINPAMIISNFHSWSQVYQWWQSLYSDKLTLTDEMKGFVDTLIEGAEDELERAKRIYEFCAKEIRYVAVEYGDSGYEPHHAEEVFLNRYGDCKDQAMLLVAFLRYANVKAYPVLIPTQSAYLVFSDFPSLNFNHAIAALEHKGELIFMDPTSETTSFGDIPVSDQKRPVLVFLDDTFKVTDTPQIEHNEVSYAMDIKIDEEENAVIERSLQTKGYFASFYRWYVRYSHPSAIEDDIRARMREISPSSELIDYTFSNIEGFAENPSLTYRFKSKKFLNPADNLRVIPYLNQIDLDYSLIGREERTFPLDWYSIFRKVAHIRIELPENLKVKSLPQNLNLQTKWYSFTIEYHLEGRTIDFNQEFSVKERFVKPDEYQEFKASLEKVFYFLRQEVILEKQ